MAHLNLDLQNLIDGCRNNDRYHEKVFFDWLKQFATNICYRYSSSRIEVNDLVCDGFLKVFKDLHLYNEEIYGCNEAAFKGWFKKVLINNCLNYRDKFHQKIPFKDENPLTLADVSDESETILDNISYNEILNSIMELPPAYKLVFNLFAIDGYTHEEIGGMLKISVGTSKSNLFKAKRLLKTALQKKMNFKKYV